MTVTIRQLYKLWGKCVQDLGRHDLWDRLGGQALVMISRCYPKIIINQSYLALQAIPQIAER